MLLVFVAIRDRDLQAGERNYERVEKPCKRTRAKDSAYVFTVTRHSLVSLSFVLVYLLLNWPEVILFPISDLLPGARPSALSRFMLGISPISASNLAPLRK
jgi:hypothetical protein